MKWIGIPAKGIRATKAGKIEKTTSPKTSVSQKIAARKSKRVRVCQEDSMSNRICPTCHGSGRETKKVWHPAQNVAGWYCTGGPDARIYSRTCQRCAGTGTVPPVMVSVPRVPRAG